MARRRLYRSNNLLKVDFDKSQIVEKELQDKISLWILRMIFRLNAKKEFIDNRNYFDKDYIANIKDLIDRLKNEIEIKNIDNSKKVGFL